MKKTEAKSNTVLNAYLREKRKEGFYCYYELKVAKGNTFNFKNIEDNQDEGLPALDKNGMVWKFSDEDSRKKPCDGASLPALPAYLILKFGQSYFFIRYALITEMKKNGRNSISYELARVVAERVFHT